MSDVDIINLLKENIEANEKILKDVIDMNKMLVENSRKIEESNRHYNKFVLCSCLLATFLILTSFFTSYFFSDYETRTVTENINTNTNMSKGDE